MSSKIPEEEPKNYLIKYTYDDLERHFIPNEPDLWHLQKFDESIDRRIELIYAFLKQRYSDIIE
ncbi:MAG: hypothetical protein H5T50_07705 [Nitrososphaeria archaeon]|nr:hypothetical protein [Nitrososphaeria archaeon]